MEDNISNSEEFHGFQVKFSSSNGKEASALKQLKNMSECEDLDSESNFSVIDNIDDFIGYLDLFGAWMEGKSQNESLIQQDSAWKIKKTKPKCITKNTLEQMCSKLKTLESKNKQFHRAVSVHLTQRIPSNSQKQMLNHPNQERIDFEKRTTSPINTSISPQNKSFILTTPKQQVKIIECQFLQSGDAQQKAPVTKCRQEQSSSSLRARNFIKSRESFRYQPNPQPLLILCNSSFQQQCQKNKNEAPPPSNLPAPPPENKTFSNLLGVIKSINNGQQQQSEIRGKHFSIYNGICLNNNQQPLKQINSPLPPPTIPTNQQISYPVCGFTMRTQQNNDNKNIMDLVVIKKKQIQKEREKLDKLSHTQANFQKSFQEQEDSSVFITQNQNTPNNQQKKSIQIFQREKLKENEIDQHYNCSQEKQGKINHDNNYIQSASKTFTAEFNHNKIHKMNATINVMNQYLGGAPINSNQNIDMSLEAAISSRQQQRQYNVVIKNKKIRSKTVISETSKQLKDSEEIYNFEGVRKLGFSQKEESSIMKDVTNLREGNQQYQYSNENENTDQDFQIQQASLQRRREQQVNLPEDNYTKGHTTNSLSENNSAIKKLCYFQKLKSQMQYTELCLSKSKVKSALRKNLINSNPQTISTERSMNQTFLLQSANISKSNTSPNNHLISRQTKNQTPNKSSLDENQRNFIVLLSQENEKNAVPFSERDTYQSSHKVIPFKSANKENIGFLEGLLEGKQLCSNSKERNFGYLKETNKREFLNKLPSALQSRTQQDNNNVNCKEIIRERSKSQIKDKKDNITSNISNMAAIAQISLQSRLRLESKQETKNYPIQEYKTIVSTFKEQQNNEATNYLKVKREISSKMSRSNSTASQKNENKSIRE